GQALGHRFKWANMIKTMDYEQIRDSQGISQANAGQGQHMGKEVLVDREALDQLAGGLKSLMDSQKSLNKQEHPLGHGLSKKLAPIDSLEKWMKEMEDTQMNLVKQQQKARKLLMAIFFTGIVPLLAFITALAIKVWILT